MKVTEELHSLATAFKDGEPYKFSTGGTVGYVWVSSDSTHLTLTVHGNDILHADHWHEGITAPRVEIRDAGWPTATTRNRLNAVLMVLGVADKVVPSQDGLSFGSKTGPLLSNNWINVTVTRSDK